MALEELTEILKFKPLRFIYKGHDYAKFEYDQYMPIFEAMTSDQIKDLLHAQELKIEHDDKINLDYFEFDKAQLKFLDGHFKDQTSLKTENEINRSREIILTE